MSIVNINSKNIDTILNDNNVIIEFSANWCGPCKRMKPEFIKAQQNYDAKYIQFGIVDVDESNDIAIKYNISSLPTVILLKNGDVVATNKGGMSSQNIIKFIDTHLNN